MEDSLTKFVNSWNKEAKDSPLAMLDFTWPSISLCELIILPLMGKRELNKIESEVISCVVNYCAEFVRQIWQGVEIASLVEFSDDHKLILKAWWEGEVNKIEFEKILRIGILERQFPLKIFKNYARNISTPHGIIAPLILGIILGLHPEYEGPWDEQDESGAKERIEKILQGVAKSTAFYFEGIAPGIELGIDRGISSIHAGDFFLSDAIYPPIGMRERYPLLERAKKFCAKISKLDLSQEQIKKIAETLLSTADFQISGIGLVILGALGPPYSKELYAKVERFGRSAGYLRPAVVELKKQLQLESDWTEKQTEEEVSKLLENEIKLGLVPFIYAPAFEAKLFITQEKVKALYRALSQGDIATGLALSAEISVEDPKLISIRLQRVYLDILAGNIEDADLSLRALLTEPGVDEDWKVYSLLGITASSLGKFEDSRRYFKIAYQLCPNNSERFDIVCNYYAKSLLGTEEMELALEIIEQGLNKTNNSLSLLLTKISLMRAMKRDTSKLVDQCKELSLLDPRVFTESFLVS